MIYRFARKIFRLKKIEKNEKKVLTKVNTRGIILKLSLIQTTSQESSKELLLETKAACTLIIEQ